MVFIIWMNEYMDRLIQPHLQNQHVIKQFACSCKLLIDWLTLGVEHKAGTSAWRSDKKHVCVICYNAGNMSVRDG